MVNIKELLESNEEELKLDNMMIRKNCMTFDNTCVQISSISSIRKFNIKEKFPTWALITAAIGLLALMSKSVFGLLLVAFGGYFLYKHFNRTQEKLLKIFMNNGYTYNIVSTNSEFTDKVIEVLMRAMNKEFIDKGNIKIDMKNCMIVDQFEDSIINFQSEVTGNIKNEVS